MGVATNRAKYFISVAHSNKHLQFLDSLHLKNVILNGTKSKFEKQFSSQLSLLNDVSFIR